MSAGITVGELKRLVADLADDAQVYIRDADTGCDLAVSYASPEVSDKGEVFVVAGRYTEN